MNKLNADVLKYLKDNKDRNQRMIAKETGLSLGTVNKSIKELLAEGLLNDDLSLSKKAKGIFDNMKPAKAVILAAGYGMRMVPINQEMPKGLLQIKGEVLIERLIRQLKESGVTQIYVVVGYMKEYYEYLVDDFGVELIVNSDYGVKNNLHSLALAAKHIDNTYVVPCDIWCEDNPFSNKELYPWYMITDETDEDSTVRLNRKNELVYSDENHPGNTMIGIAYLCDAASVTVKNRLSEMDTEKKYANSFWEDALYQDGKMIVYANVVNNKNCLEINTYEQLRAVDSNSDNLQSEAMDVICEALNVNNNDIVNIDVLKKGMTNRSFLFTCMDKRYIMRIPGEGTSQLINREHEAAVYNTIDGLKICDDIAYINPDNGYKITRYIEGARVCDPDNEMDLKLCMAKLRDFHNMSLKIGHEFNIFQQIEFYESLWNGQKSVYRDYDTTKENVLSLKEYVDKHAKEKCLTHIDAVPDNFLFANIDGNEEIRLIDWEYAGMQDPHVDVAMFCIYSLYDRQQVDRLIDIYFEGQCEISIRKKIYCYIAMCGLLWSNWCEYKRQLGVEFGEYSLRQYRYAKDYYKIAQEIK